VQVYIFLPERQWREEKRKRKTVHKKKQIGEGLKFGGNENRKAIH